MRKKNSHGYRGRGGEGFHGSVAIGSMFDTFFLCMVDWGFPGNLVVGGKNLALRFRSGGTRGVLQVGPRKKRFSFSAWRGGL